MRVKVVKAILWFFVGLAIPVAIVRFIHGLGSTTNMTDTTPWGFWIGFDVLAGVALAAGGFVVAAIVYIFHLKDFKPILRPAVLTAFLGYVLVALALVFDLGLPWNIWRPTLYWQHHSALFEVAWCVMLYLTVLALEFFPVILEKLPFPRFLNFMRFITLPLVILGIMLSTLHQSSLGTLFLIMPFRLNPLWYSPLLPLLFFVSAVALGLTMVIVESLTSSWLYKKHHEWDLLRRLSWAAVFVLLTYLVIRLGDLQLRGALTSSNLQSWEGMLFIFEIVISSILPIILFLIARTRNSNVSLAGGAWMTVIGIVLYRINVGGIATITSTGTNYVPSWMEFAISIGLISAAGLVFLFFVEHFSVYPESVGITSAKPTLFFDELSQVRLGEPWTGAVQRYSLILVLAIAFSIFLLPRTALHGANPIPSPTFPTRLVQAVFKAIPGSPAHKISLAKPGDPAALKAQGAVDVFLLDANRNGEFVLFNHQEHSQRMGGKKSCHQCHHIHKPLDWATACWQCHGDMYEKSDTFNHDLHVSKMGRNKSCITCHRNKSEPHSSLNAPACLECHKRMVAHTSLVKKPKKDGGRRASSYMNAMHTLCVRCHQQEEQKKPEWKNQLSICSRCHQYWRNADLRAWLPSMVKDKTQLPPERGL